MGGTRRRAAAVACELSARLADCPPTSAMLRKTSTNALTAAEAHVRPLPP